MVHPIGLRMDLFVFRVLPLNWLSAIELTDNEIMQQKLDYLQNNPVEEGISL